MEKKIVVRIVTSNIALPGIVEQGRTSLQSGLMWDSLDFKTQDPDVVYFLTGGSESKAIDGLNKDKFYILLAGRGNNAFASAMETKAWMNHHGFRSILLPLNEAGDFKTLEKHLVALLALKELSDKNIAVIGKISPWLIASAIDAKVLKARLGIVLKNIPWTRVPTIHKYRVLNSFSEAFPQVKSMELDETGRIYQALSATIKSENLAGLAVECFSLISEVGVSACLPLSKLNDEGIPAACEGDLVSLVGMMIAQKVCGIIPWMANSLGEHEHKLGFAHCTIAASLVKNFEVTTHYETGKPYAIDGEWEKGKVTVFRLNYLLNKVHLFTGEIVSGLKLKDACRTQIWVKHDKPEAGNFMVANSLGNHVLIIPGDHYQSMFLFFGLAGIEML